KATEKLEKELKEAIPNLRVDIDTRSDTVQSKIRDAEMLKINYIVVIGDKEEENKTLAVRSRGEKPQFGVKRDKFFKDLKEEIENRN
ncbi:threonine--tRNA ligase, partial [Candidatus Pacearchaeota archaeon]|nr:threonine--tRNA ligase [Candidatus Pacearchaeota archaeon]